MEQQELEQEVRRLRSLLRRTGLEREVLSIAVLEGRYGPDGPAQLGPE